MKISSYIYCAKPAESLRPHPSGEVEKVNEWLLTIHFFPDLPHSGYERARNGSILLALAVVAVTTALLMLWDLQRSSGDSYALLFVTWNINEWCTLGPDNGNLWTGKHFSTRNNSWGTIRTGAGKYNRSDHFNLNSLLLFVAFRPIQLEWYLVLTEVRTMTELGRILSVSISPLFWRQKGRPDYERN